MGDVKTVYATFSLLSYDGGKGQSIKHWILPGILFAFFLHLHDMNNYGSIIIRLRGKA